VPADVSQPARPRRATRSAANDAEALLVVNDLHVAHGSVPALRDVSLSVSPGELVAIVGENGAGKSTLLGSIMGLFTPSRGGCTFAGDDMRDLSVEARVRRGLALVPERRPVFEPLTVLENLRVAVPARVPTVTRSERLEQAFALFPRLHERRRIVAGALICLRATGTTILLAERNAELALGIADRACALERGTARPQ
jgi:branched-chain amino acid transport system ATP-binding protein